MKKNYLIIIICASIFQFNTWATAKEAKNKEPSSRLLAGLRGYSLEEAVSYVLLHSKLAEEKANNPVIQSMSLNSINVERGEGAFTVWMTYKSKSGGAPCTIKAEGKSVNTVPDGAAGVNIRPKLVSMYTACAQN